MQPTQVLAALHTGVVPLQFALVRHCTQTLGFGTVLHFGVGALHCASVWHSSTTIGVGGDPGPEPLPSVGQLLAGAPNRPDAWMLAGSVMILGAGFYILHREALRRG